jgi:hypothetical protein
MPAAVVAFGAISCTDSGLQQVFGQTESRNLRGINHRYPIKINGFNTQFYGSPSWAVIELFCQVSGLDHAKVLAAASSAF